MMRLVLVLGLVAALAIGLVMRGGPSSPPPDPVTAGQAAQGVAGTIDRQWQSAWQATVALRGALSNYLQNPTDQSKQVLQAQWQQTAADIQSSLWHRELIGAPVAARRLAMWPLDQGEIDYVDTERYQPHAENPFATASIVRNEAVIEGAVVPMKPIKTDYLVKFASIEGVPGHGPLGVQAVEFLIWGEAGPDGAPGQRPHSDYARTEEACTTDPRAKDRLRECQRRLVMVQAIAEQLEADVKAGVISWSSRQAPLRNELEQSPQVSLSRILGSWRKRIREEVLGKALNAQKIADLPQEFSASAPAYFAALADSLTTLWTDSGLRGWAWQQDATAAADLDAALSVARSLPTTESTLGDWLKAQELNQQAVAAWESIATAMEAIETAAAQSPGSGTLGRAFVGPLSS